MYISLFSILRFGWIVGLVGRRVMNCLLRFVILWSNNRGGTCYMINTMTSSETPIIEMKLHKLTKC